MIGNRAALTLAIVATALLQGCAAILASNEPLRNGLIPRVQQGMTREQVAAIMGPPDQQMAFERSQTLAWDYRYTDTWGFMAMFAVVFGPDHRVQSTTTWRINDGRSGTGMN
jgi:outer membrane protein assembly factor BamE (lipoprotein component of BamABCDE complex)